MGRTRNLSGCISAEGPVTPPLTDDVWSYYLLVIGRLLALCSAPISPPSSVCSYQFICCKKRRGREKEREEAVEGATTSQYQAAFVVSATGTADPPRRRRGRAGPYQRCQTDTSRWTCDGIILSQVLLGRPHSYRDIYCLTGPKLEDFCETRIFLTAHDNHELRNCIVAPVFSGVFDPFLVRV